MRWLHFLKSKFFAQYCIKNRYKYPYTALYNSKKKTSNANKYPTGFNNNNKQLQFHETVMLDWKFANGKF